MSYQRSIIANLILGLSLILAGCAPVQAPENAANRTSTLPPTTAPTGTPIPTATPSPTPTLTPTPVSFADAVGRGTLKELETYGKGRIRASGFSQDGSIFAAVTLRGVYVFSPSNWEETTYIPATPGTNIQFVRFSRDGSLFAGGDSAGNVTFWDTKTWEVRQVIAAHKGPITGLDISPDNKTCITIGDRKEVSLWNLEDGVKIKSMTRAKKAGPVHFSQDGSWFMLSEATTYSDLTTWKTEDLSFLNRLPQMGRQAPEQAVSPFSDMVASYGFGTINVHDFEKNKDYQYNDIFGVFDDVQMAFVNEDILFVKSNYADSYRLYDLRTGSMREESMRELPKLKSKNPDLRFITEEEEIKALGFDPYPKMVAVSPQGDRLILGEGMFNLSEKSMSQPSLVNDSQLWRNAVILDNGYVAVVDPSQPDYPKKGTKGNLIVSILDFAEMTSVDKKLIPYDLPDGIATTALTSDGTKVAAGLLDGSLYIWDVNTGEEIANFRAHTKVYEIFGFYAAFKDFSFDNDGSHIVTVGLDGMIKVWSLGENSPILTIGGKMAVFSPDGKRLVYVDSYDRIQIMSLFDKEPQVSLEGQTGEIMTLTFSKDGSLLISGGEESISVWSMVDHDLLMKAPLYGDIRSMALNPDGTRLYVSTFDGVISAWGYAP